MNVFIFSLGAILVGIGGFMFAAMSIMIRDHDSMSPSGAVAFIVPVVIGIVGVFTCAWALP